MLWLTTPILTFAALAIVATATVGRTGAGLCGRPIAPHYDANGALTNGAKIAATCQ
jgi:hypothetical protein